MSTTQSEDEPEEKPDSDEAARSSAAVSHEPHAGGARSRPPSGGGGKNGTNAAGMIIGGIVWLVIIGAIAWRVLAPERAEVLLDLRPPADSTAAPEYDASVSVWHDGYQVTSGVVEVTVREPSAKEYLYSRSLDPVASGNFVGTLRLPTKKGQPTAKVTARFVGRYESGAGKEGGEEGDGKVVPLDASTSIYVGVAPPPSRVGLTTVVGIFLLFTLALIITFTGTLTRRKARFLFALMYLTTFLSAFVPLVLILTLPESPYLMELMERAPMGLVQAKATGMEDPQWVINIGGVFTARERPGDEMGTVEGGLSIPFFVVMLALFGAAVNLMRKVPAVQKDSRLRSLPGDLGESPLTVVLDVAASPFVRREEYGSREAAKNAAKIREEVIENFMYYLTAPMLAIAVYFLLQVVADNLALPVLVVMAFATGLASPMFVEAVIGVAEGRLRGARPENDVDESQSGT